jgi:hypothetical protein
MNNLDATICTLASAATALDRAEKSLTQARIQIADMSLRGEPVDLAKVERVLLALTEQVNQSIENADNECLNLLKDSRLQVRLAECGSGNNQPSMQVDLTLISLEKLMAHKLRDEHRTAESMIGLIDAMCRVVLQNVNILSSLILTLLAARDYTKDVVGLVVADDPMALSGAAAMLRPRAISSSAETSRH